MSELTAAMDRLENALEEITKGRVQVEKDREHLEKAREGTEIFRKTLEGMEQANREEAEKLRGQESDIRKKLAGVYGGLQSIRREMSQQREAEDRTFERLKEYVSDLIEDADKGTPKTDEGPQGKEPDADAEPEKGPPLSNPADDEFEPEA